MFDRHQQAVRLNQPVEDVLQHIFGVAWVGHTPANKVEQAGALALDDLGNALILFDCHPLQAGLEGRHVAHSLV
jgi:hypothetical protein